MKTERIQWRQPEHDLQCMFCTNQAELTVKISAPELPDLFNLVVCGVCAEKTEGELLAIIKGGHTHEKS